MIRKFRYAPSPTGKIHLGQVKAAFFPYAFAKKFNGEFILRIEDTDQNRNLEGAVENLINDLNWLGIKYDKGPESLTSKNEYFQSQRSEIYQKYINELLESKKAYKAYETQEERAEQIKLQRSKGGTSAYFGEELSIEQQQKFESEGRKPVIRLKVPKNQIIEFKDEVYGKVTVNTDQIGDMVIQKSDGTPMYNFCVVIDDHLMEITDVIRGFGHLSNTGKQVLLYKIFGWDIPNFAHFSDIQNESTPGKLSKRHGAKSVEQYRLEGYLPEAIKNYIVTISCSFKFATKDDEVMSESKYMESLEIKKLLHTNAKFNTAKLDWFNGQHLRLLSDEEFCEKSIDWLKNSAPILATQNPNIDQNLINKYLLNIDLLKQILPLIKERINKFEEIIEYIKFFFESPSNNIDFTHSKHTKEEFENAINSLYNSLKSISEPWTHADWESTIRKIADELGWKHGDMFMALRLKIVGTPISPPLYESMVILGQEECIKRLEI